MAKKWQKVVALAASAVMVGSLIGMAACSDDEQPYNIVKRDRTGWQDTKEYTYNTYTGQMPAIWTELNTSDVMDIELIQYLNSSFFEFNYEFDEDGNIVPGGFTVDYSAATGLKDVTADYVGQYGITAEMAKDGGHAFAITLRDDLTWDDGTEIHAEDFVYTMSQQLSPNYLFAQASNYYSGNYILHNAKEYVYQGQADFFDNYSIGYTYADLKIENGKYTLGGQECYIPLTSTLGHLGDTFEDTIAAYGDYLDVDAYNELKKLANDEGNVEPTEKAIELLTQVITANPAWQETEEYIVNYMYVYYEYPEMSFDEVGFFVGENENELVIVIDNTIHPVDEDGNLTYEAAYYLESFPLVKRDLWEKLENSSTKPYTNAYNTTSVANSASWGPYKLTNFQAGRTYTVSRNTEWYGYGMEQYDDQYQTDNIVVDYIPEWNTAWQAFQQGDLDGIGIDTTIINQYRNSERAYFTPETYTFSLNLQSATAVYKKGENIMLKYDEFRQALSLALDRDDYCSVNAPSSMGALGYLNELYYYDVENGGVYRETDAAKEALLNAYGATKNSDGSWTVGSTKYTDIDDAVNALTGYNLTLARDLMQKAYDKAVAAGDYTDGDKIVLTLGVQEQTANAERNRAYLETAFNQALVGTPMEGKLEIQFFTTTDNWDQEFSNGDYDICFSAWGSAAFNPSYLLGATQIWDANRYATGWDPKTVEFTLTLEGYNGGEPITMDLKLWDACLQGLTTDDEGRATDYDFSGADYDIQLQILAAEETAILGSYWSIPVYSSTTASLISYKCEYISYEYNTFMGFGGVRYMSYNFDDTEWEEFVAADKDGILNYTF